MPKLIENDFPFAELSLVAERESWRKEVYRPVYYLHKWWARRLGSVFRGILLGACLEDGEDFWECFYKKNTFENTVVFDPFMGSGVTVGEAVKLGCKAVGRDVNPVAYLACRAALSRYTDAEVLSTYRCLERTLALRLLSYFQTRTKDRPRLQPFYTISSLKLSLVRNVRKRLTFSKHESSPRTRLLRKTLRRVRSVLAVVL